MKMVPYSVTRSIGRSMLKTKKNSPHIFFVGGVIGAIGSTVLACRATLRLPEALDQAKEQVDTTKKLATIEAGEKQLPEAEYHGYVIYAYAKAGAKVARLYAPSAALGIASIAALTGSHVQLTRRNSALSATLALVSQAYDDYRLRVREEIGEERELELYRGLSEVELKGDGKSTSKELAKVADPNKYSPYARIFDETSIHWENCAELNRLFVQCQQNWFNHRLHAYGHVFLNEVYDHLGFERTQPGQVVGWIRDGDGDGYIDFGLFEADNSRFVNGIEKCIVLDFNVDGVIYDKI